MTRTGNEILLQAEASSHIRTKEGKTALMYSAEEGYLSIVKQLAKLTENINEVNNRGISTLMFATKSGNIAIVRYLLELGADINIRDKNGWTALSLASHHRHQTIANFLIQNGGVEGRPKGAYAGFEPDGHFGVDELGISSNVDSFAKLLSAKKLEPPLAIGLFGYSGSGKSFFIAKLMERISILSKKVRLSMEESGQGQKEYSYYSRIAQIKFNAWHYAEGNLWASMIEHIFNNLKIYDSEEKSETLQRRDKLLLEIDENLKQWQEESKKLEELKSEKNTALFEKEQEIKEKQKRIRANEEEFANEDFERQSLQNLWKKKIKNLVSEEALARIQEIKGFQESLQRLGLDIKQKDAEKTLDFLAHALGDPKRNESLVSLIFSKENWSQLWQKNRRKVLLFSFLFLCILAGPIALPYYLKAKNIAISWLNQKISLLLSFVLGNGALVAFAKRNFATLSSIWNKAKQLSPKVMELDKNAEAEEQILKETFEKQKQEMQQEQQTLEAEKHKIELEKRELEQELQSIHTKIIDAKQQARQNQNNRLLSNYIQSRAASDDYRKYLGLPAQIRRDLEKLSDLMENYNKSIETGEDIGDDSHMINRIVLYIDDLDRCSTKRVVEIIEAVHLLLAFPLFTVIVAADPRWLTQALQIEYKELFSGEIAIDSDGDGLVDLLRATPHDYLEKIFQISFWLYPMDVSGRKNLVEKLTSNIDLKSNSYRKRSKKL
ncbi:MAG: ankyrin repeat domain-containing protein [Spirochaetota bacterium]